MPDENPEYGAQSAQESAGRAALRTQVAARLIGTGAERIAAERQRQITAEGWSPDHDDEHTRGEMAAAAEAYAFTARCLAMQQHFHEPPLDIEGTVPNVWPWDEDWWKPSATDPIRNLEKAGALIAAEIDRLIRALGNPNIRHGEARPAQIDGSDA